MPRQKLLINLWHCPFTGVGSRGDMQCLVYFGVISKGVQQSFFVRTYACQWYKLCGLPSKAPRVTQNITRHHCTHKKSMMRNKKYEHFTTTRYAIHKLVRATQTYMLTDCASPYLSFLKSSCSSGRICREKSASVYSMLKLGLCFFDWIWMIWRISPCCKFSQIFWAWTWKISSLWILIFLERNMEKYVRMCINNYVLCKQIWRILKSLVFADLCFYAPWCLLRQHGKILCLWS